MSTLTQEERTGFNLTYKIKIEQLPLGEGWIFTGIPRIKTNPKQIQLDVLLDEESQYDPLYCSAYVKMKKRTKWETIKTEGGLLEKFIDLPDTDCEECCFSNFYTSCMYCGARPAAINQLIEEQCYIWFKYAKTESLFYYASFTWLLINEFQPEKLSVRLPREIVQYIAKLIYASNMDTVNVLKLEGTKNSRPFKKLKY